MAGWRYRTRKRRWRRWLAPGLTLLVLVGWYAAQPLVAPREWVKVGTQFGTCGERGRPYHCVTDGDTVTLGYGASARRIRLTGFDAPEIAGACPAESAAALRAQSALRDWLNAAPFEWDGGVTPDRDTYGRELRSVRRVDRQGNITLLADHMIETGNASGDGPWQWRDWCG